MQLSFNIKSRPYRIIILWDFCKGLLALNRPQANPWILHFVLVSLVVSPFNVKKVYKISFTSKSEFLLHTSIASGPNKFAYSSRSGQLPDYHMTASQVSKISKVMFKKGYLFFSRTVMFWNYYDLFLDFKWSKQNVSLKIP